MDSTEREETQEYETPELVRHGTLEDLTAGSAGLIQSDVVSGG